MTRINNRRAVPWGRPIFLMVAVVAIAFAATMLLRSDEPKKNVLIITIDTCRADALNTQDTPALMELAARGTRFSKARTPVPLTVPGHGSLLTGLDPREHGLRTNTAPALTARSVAEDFSDAGYATAAFVAASVLHKRYRLDRGFHRYEGPPLPPKGSPEFKTLDATVQVERFRRWMKARPEGKPFFAWVHLWEPHARYRPYDGDERRAGTAGTDTPRERYVGEVRKADWAIEQLLKEIDPETTIVLVTSDHGESLGEHNERTHGHLCYGATMDIPMILAGPGVESGRTETRVCDLTDVAPTLRKLCGVGEKGGGGGLLELAKNRIVVGESLYSYGMYRWAQQTVAYDGRHSLIDGGPSYELYDRSVDPSETAPLAALTPDGERPEQEAARVALDRALVEYRSNAPAVGGTPYSTAGSPYGAVMVDGFGFLKPKENRALLDVRPRLQPTERVLNPLNMLIVTGPGPAVEAALRNLGPIEAKDTANPAFALARGRALLFVLERKQEAKKAFLEAVARGYPQKALQGLIDRCK